jgi:hypothetical protein
VNWFPVYTDMIRHRKSMRLCRLLKDDRAWSYVIALWAWMAEQDHDGWFPPGPGTSPVTRDALATHDATHEIAQAAGWKGDPEVFVGALIDSGWVDLEDGGFQAHEFDIVNAKYLEKKKNSAARSKRYRDNLRAQRAQKTVTRDARVSHDPQYSTEKHKEIGAAPPAQAPVVAVVEEEIENFSNKPPPPPYEPSALDLEGEPAPLGEAEEFTPLPVRGELRAPQAPTFHYEVELDEAQEAPEPLNVAEVWQAVIQHFRDTRELQYGLLYLQRLSPSRIEGNALVCNAADRFFADWAKGNFEGAVLEALAATQGKAFTWRIESPDQHAREMASVEAEETPLPECDLPSPSVEPEKQEAPWEWVRREFAEARAENGLEVEPEIPGFQKYVENEMRQGVEIGWIVRAHRDYLSDHSGNFAKEGWPTRTFMNPRVGRRRALCLRKDAQVALGL